MFECTPQAARQQYGTEEDCRKYDDSYCRLFASLPGESSQIVDSWQACNVALTGLSCDALRFGGDVAACKPPAGSRQDGEPCLDNAQCASLRCNSVDNEAHPELASCGTCAARVAAGAVCEDGADACAPGSVCANKICVVPAAEGAKCDEGVCQGELVCIEGLCRRPMGVALGGACMAADDCVDWFADCIAGKCAERPSIARGGACVPPGGATEPTAFCQGDDYCDASKHCVARRYMGEACASNEECGFLLVCEGGKCAPPTDAMCAAGKPPG
jgi:hypothetical protein